MELQDQLKAYLAGLMPQAVDLTITDFERAPIGGSRDTFTFGLEWEEKGVAQTGSYVLRREPEEATLLVSDRETEFRVLKSLEGSGIPVPKVYWTEGDPKILDRPFTIMERVTGEATRFWQLIGGENVSLREERADETATLLAKLHTLDWEKRGLGFLGIPAKATSYAEAQIGHWNSEFNRVNLEPNPILSEAFAWMRTHIPAARYTSLVHGDFKADNIMYEGGKVSALLDWEMPGIGDPIADLAWMSMGFWEVDDLACGLISKEDLISKWEKRTGYTVEEDAFLFWMVFSNVKMAVILLTGGHSFATKATGFLEMGLTPYMSTKLLWDICELLEF